VHDISPNYRKSTLEKLSQVGKFILYFLADWEIEVGVLKGEATLRSETFIHNDVSSEQDATNSVY